MRAVRGESGFTLTELLIAMSLMLIVLSATLTTLEGFVTTNQRNLTLNDMRESARLGIDTLARELRNAGGRPDQGSPVERAGSNDLVFDDVDPTGGGSGSASARRVRYCLEQSTPKTGKLWRQEAAWTDPATNPPPATPSCPDDFYGPQELVAEGVVNHAVGGNPAVFSYDTPDLAQLTTIGARLFVDTDVDQRPSTTELSTGVRIRNRNRGPIADFTPTAQGNRHVLLNAGASSDPEGQQLEYEWSCAQCAYQPIDGQVVDHQVQTVGTYSFTLTVTDPAGLTSETTRTVLVS